MLFHLAVCVCVCGGGVDTVCWAIGNSAQIFKDIAFHQALPLPGAVFQTHLRSGTETDTRSHLNVQQQNSSWIHVNSPATWLAWDRPGPNTENPPGGGGPGRAPALQTWTAGCLPQTYARR